MIDKSALREVVESYLFAIDTKDATGVSNCFCRKGTMSSTAFSDLDLSGRGAIEAKFRSLLPTLGATRHMMNSFGIDTDGNSVRSLMLGVSIGAGHAQTGDPVTVRELIYHDRWVQEAGHWRIAERVHESNWWFQQPMGVAI